MALDSCKPTPSPLYPMGAVLFDINPGQSGWPHTYHAMLVREGASRSAPSGWVSIPVFDMAPDGLRYPNYNPKQDHDPRWILNPRCYIGTLPHLGAEGARVAVEAFLSLVPAPGSSGKSAIYSLATHGIHEEDPNAPGEFLEGVRCSCASLIEWCYEQVGEDSDLVDKDAVPQQTREELWARLIRDKPFDERRAKKMMSRWGLRGDGPWPVLLPAYQMRAFQREAGELPYKPVPDDHPFA